MTQKISNKFALILIINFLLLVPVYAGNLINLNISDLKTSWYPQIINSKIIYLNSQNYLWSYDTNNASSTQLLINEIPISSGRFIKQGNFVYFVNQNESNSIWRTDGIETNLVVAESSSLYETVNKHVISVKTDYSEVYALESRTKFDISSLNLNQFISFSIDSCLLNEDTLVFQHHNSDSIYVAKNNKVEAVNLSFIPSESKEFIDISSQLLNECYFSFYNRQTNERTFFKIDSEGNSELIESGNIRISKLFAFENAVYAASGNQILQVSGNGLEPVYTGSEYGFVNFWSSGGLLFAYTIADPCLIVMPCPPGILEYRDAQVTVFDKNWIPINHIKFTVDYVTPLFHFEDSKGLVVNDYKSLELKLLSHESLQKQFSTQDYKALSIIGSNQDSTYLFANSLPTNQSQILSFSNEVLVSGHLNGLWFNPELQSQGLSIHTGTRKDGSQYIFVSMFAHKGGKAFWLAGNNELVPGSEQQNIEMYAYKGNSYLPSDPGSTNEQSLFGTITIQPQTCNTIRLKTDFIDIENTELELTRATNTQNSLCQD